VAILIGKQPLGRLHLTCGALPPCAWHTLAPRIALLRHGLPFGGLALQECR
jgi:hypothetical protein